MDNLLILLHVDADGRLGKPAFEAVSAGLRLAADAGGPPVVVGIVGHATGDAVAQLSGCGAAKILTAEHPELAQSRYASDAAAAQAAALAAGCSVIVAPMTSRWARALPGVALRLGGRVDTHVTGIGGDGSVSVTRWFYRQRMEATLQRVERPWMLLLDPGAFPAWSGSGAPVAATPVSVDLGPTRTIVTGFEAPAAEQQTIRPDADLLFVAGAGWTKKQADGQTHPAEAESLIVDFLRVSRASLGSSKSLVDLSGEGQSVLPFMTHLNQVGQTGSTPRHPKGLATCCHGEEPHVVGWRFITERRAVNLDPNCGWARGKADVVYVADAFAVMKALNSLLAG